MNVMLIVLDTLRADHLGCYGYARETSPNLDKLAAEGVLFENCISECAHTVPSFTSMFTGLSPVGHRVVGTNWCTPNENVDLVDDETPMLAEKLQEQRYVTCAIDNLIHSMAFHPKWFARGIEYYITYAVKYVQGKARADDVNARALPWIEQHRGDKFYMFIHYWDPHQGYSPPPPFDSRFPADCSDMPVKKLRDGSEFVPRCGKVSLLDEKARATVTRYDGEIAYVDDRVGQVVEALKKFGIYDDTLIVVTGDHGDDMIEHTCNFEHREVYDSCIRVPLIYKLPKAMQNSKNVGLRVPGIVQHEDLMPTLLDAAGAEPPPTMEGRSVMPLLMGDASEHRDAAFSTGTWIWDHDHWRSAEMCVRTKQWKLIERADISKAAESGKELIGLFRRRADLFMALPRRELLNLEEDPDEQFDVFAEHPDVAEELGAKLRPWIESGLFVRPRAE